MTQKNEPKTWSVEEAQDHLDELLDLAEAKQPQMIKHNDRHYVVMSTEQYQELEQQRLADNAQGIGSQIAQIFTGAEELENKSFKDPAELIDSLATIEHSIEEIKNGEHYDAKDAIKGIAKDLGLET